VVRDPFFKDEAFFNDQESLPLCASGTKGPLKEILGENLSWDQFLWGIDSLKIRNSNSDNQGYKVSIGPILNYLLRPTRQLKQPTAAIAAPSLSN